ncbi:hypothetical protein KAT92_00995 [Candidatus Babeliales bacterium]|nr:hypothetical protein [Candidatus Babeliales bacterium]
MLQNTMVVSFETKHVSASDKLSINFVAVAGHPVAKVEGFKGGTGMLARIKNISHGLINMFHCIHADTFAAFYEGCKKEAANNAELFDHILPGDCTLTFSRTKEGQPVNISQIDLRGALDFLSSISVAGVSSAPTVVESEEFDFAALEVVEVE